MRDHDAGPKNDSFTDNRADIAAGAAYLREPGHQRLVLLGQSMGTNRVLYYQAASGDPDIAGTVLVSSPGDLFGWNEWQFGKEKARAIVNEALKLQQTERQHQMMLIDLGPLGKTQAAVPAGSNAAFVAIESAGHEFENYEPMLNDKVLGWLDTVAP
jgi:pimeloyl-ACP methyl ester carboxylesterase